MTQTTFETAPEADLPHLELPMADFVYDKPPRSAHPLAGASAWANLVLRLATLSDNPVPARGLARLVADRRLRLELGLHWEQPRFDAWVGYRRAWALLDVYGNTVTLSGGRDDGASTDGEVIAEWRNLNWESRPDDNRLARLSPYSTQTFYNTHTSQNTLIWRDPVRYEQPPLPAGHAADPALQAAVAFSGLTNYVLNNPVEPHNIVCAVRSTF